MLAFTWNVDPQLDCSLPDRLPHLVESTRYDGFPIRVGCSVDLDVTGDYGVRSSFDVAPTVVGLVGAPRPPQIDGRDVLADLKPQASNQQDRRVAERRSATASTEAGRRRA